MRRYTPLRPSRGTQWPPRVRDRIRWRDQGCLGPRLGMPYPCVGQVELDHVRASGAVGKKSASTVANGASLCSSHHQQKTLEGRKWRPRILAWIEAHPVAEPPDEPEHGHVELVPERCEVCASIAAARARMA